MASSAYNQYYSMDNGCPAFAPQASLRIGDNLEGPLLIQDINLLETISHITHERIPERLVHAKGAGAWGNFKVTHDISEFTDAKFLNEVGKTTDLFARFSTVVGEKGSADSVRDSRGFAFKLYTEDGNLDWLFFSTPTFPIRDGGKFPSFVHCQKREPQTGLRNANTFWDFMSENPETFNTLMWIFSDYGTPMSYRHSNIYSVNTYKFTTEQHFVYVKIFMKPKQGTKNHTRIAAEKIAGEDPDAFTRDLYDNIFSKKYPQWDVFAQIVKPNDVNTYEMNIFDPTLRWPEEKIKPIQFGIITLNENIKDEFEEVEQASFNPTAIVPGWDISEDPILQTRLFAYGSASRYRLGINLHQIPVNKPHHSYKPNPTKRDGVGYINRLKHTVPPNYISNNGNVATTTSGANQKTLKGTVQTYESKSEKADYDQPQKLWGDFTEQEQMAVVSNVAINLSQATEDVRKKTYGVFKQIDPTLGNKIEEATTKEVEKATKMQTTTATEMQAPTGDHLRFSHAGRNRAGIGG